MKVLFAAAKKNSGRFSPFVEEQKEALLRDGIEVLDYAHTAHGVVNYLKWVPKLRSAIKEIKPEVVHAHFGLTGLMAGLAAIGTGVPVVVTYHGCDINDKKLRPFSRMAMRLAAWNIFVSKRQMVNAYGSEARAAKAKKGCLMPCGINTKLFDAEHVDGEWFESKFGNGEKVLFAIDFGQEVKDPALAKAVIEDLKLKIADLELVELKGYTREQVVTLMYKCKALLLTSIREGSPQVVKEALASDCPIVSVDVGDVAERVDGLVGCYVVKSRDSKELAEALEKAISFGRTKGRERLLADGLDNEQVAHKLIEIYKQVQ